MNQNGIVRTLSLLANILFAASLFFVLIWWWLSGWMFAGGLVLHGLSWLMGKSKNPSAGTATSANCLQS